MLNTEIYYFTGTGNSLSAAKHLADNIDGQNSVLPMVASMNSGKVICSASVTGFVFPLYHGGLPEIVERFLMGLVFSESQYIFTVITRGGSKGRAITDIRRILRRKGRDLNAAFYLTMPGNYIPMYSGCSEKKAKQKISKAEKNMEGMSKIINAGEDRIDKEGFLTRKIAGIIHKRWKTRLPENDSVFSVDEACTSCGLCSEICPVNNIQMVEGRPVWKHSCQECMACIQYCPVQAIQAGEKTRKRRRYHFPGVRADIIEKQKILQEPTDPAKG